MLVNGEISEVGSYDELMTHDGAFAQFLKTYLLEKETDEGEEDEEGEFDGETRLGFIIFSPGILWTPAWSGNIILRVAQESQGTFIFGTSFWLPWLHPVSRS